MNYALINGAGEVLEIKKNFDTSNNESFRMVRLRDFDEGDELKFYIIVLNTRVENGEEVTVEYSAVKQSPYVATLLEENSRLKASLADLWEVVLLGGVE